MLAGVCACLDLSLSYHVSDPLPLDLFLFLSLLLLLAQATLLQQEIPVLGWSQDQHLRVTLQLGREREEEGGEGEEEREGGKEEEGGEGEEEGGGRKGEEEGVSGYKTRNAVINSLVVLLPSLFLSCPLLPRLQKLVLHNSFEHKVPLKLSIRHHDSPFLVGLIPRPSHFKLIPRGLMKSCNLKTVQLTSKMLCVNFSLSCRMLSEPLILGPHRR